MSGTPKVDLAGVVMAGVFEPASSRFSEGFGRTGRRRGSADRTRPLRAWSRLRPAFQDSEASTKRTPQNSSFESRSRVSEVEVSTGDRGVSQGRAARGRLFGLSLPRIWLRKPRMEKAGWRPPCRAEIGGPAVLACGSGPRSCRPRPAGFDLSGFTRSWFVEEPTPKNPSALFF